MIERNTSDHDLPLAPRALQTIAAVAIAGAAVAIAGLAVGQPDGDELRWVYLGGLAAAALAVGFVTFGYEDRRQAIAHAKHRAHVLAAFARYHDPTEISQTAVQAASADLVLLEDIGDAAHAELLRGALGLPEHGEANAVRTNAMPTEAERGRAPD